MREIIPPQARHISRAKTIVDGVVFGKKYEPSRPIPRPAVMAPAWVRARRQLDAVQLRKTSKNLFSWTFVRRLGRFVFRRLYVSIRRLARFFFRAFPFLFASPRRALYASLVGGVSFGMVSMGLIQNLALSDDASANTDAPIQADTVLSAETELKRELMQDGAAYNPNDDLFLQFFSEATKDEYSNQMRELVRGYPIEDMLPYILEKDRIVSAFLVGIAKKESNWGKRVPVLDGQDCFNYWGYRGLRRLMGTGGHTCFNSRKDAVDTVALRLETLIHSQKLDTPAKLIIWKCGYSCDGHSRESVRKWIADVDLYFRQLNQEEGS